MKKILLILVLIVGAAKAQTVNIPDANFKAALLSSDETNGIAYSNNLPVKIDTNNDGEIQESEALAIQILNVGADVLQVSDAPIADLTGLEHFVNLTEFYCNGNVITSLDLTALTSIIKVDASQNLINTVSVAGLPNLKFLFLQNNQIQSIDLQGLPRLAELNLSSNFLTSVNLPTLTDLEILNIGANQLTTIDFTNTTNAQQIYLGNNQLTSLNLSGFNNLITLDCSQNQLTSLDFSNLSSLQFLYCGLNLFSVLEVSNLVNLINLQCNNNNLTTLDVTPLTNLQSLNCSFNNLTSLNLSATSILESLDCSYNQLASIDVSNQLFLSTLHIENNLLTMVDLSANTILFQLFCQNNLFSSLDLNNNTSLVFLDASDNSNLEMLFFSNGVFSPPGFPAYIGIDNSPNLRYVCVQEEGIPYVQSQINLGSFFQEVVVNSYCSFSPSGNSNTITGTVKFDADNNGCDASDNSFPYLKVNITDGTNQGASFLDGNGNYNFYAQTGNYTLTPAIENPSWFNFSPANATITFDNNNNNAAIQDFCLTSNGVHPDVSVVIAPVLYAQPGGTGTYQLVFSNKGNQTLSGTVGLNFNDGAINFLSASLLPSLVSDGNLQWNYTNLRPFENVSIELAFSVNSSTDIPPVNAGDLLVFSASILPVDTDETPLDNEFVLEQPIVDADIVNDIICLEGSVIDPSYVGAYLHYMINFENVGNLAAQNTVIRFEVDPTIFDMSTLQLLDASYPVYTRISGNVVEYIFENINLEIGGHGHILLKMKTRDDLPVSTVVSNRANIFYDYNAPVDTGTVNTVFQTLSNNGFEVDTSVLLSPNPAKNQVSIKTVNPIKSVEIYDAQGRIITTQLGSQKEARLDVSHLIDGIYFVKIKTQTGISVQKLIKN